MNIEQYKTFIQERRKIGLTIDPATAETFFNYCELGDPYSVLDQEYKSGCVGRESFARNPGAEYNVWFYDLPEATRVALEKRDGAKLRFPYGLSITDDIINKPASVDEATVAALRASE
jgi:hypothetical protein